MIAATALAAALLGQTSLSVKPLKTFSGVRIVRAVGASTGSMLAVSLENNTIRIIDAATQATRWSLAGHTQPCYGIAFSPDGRYLASGDDTARIFLWDLKTGKKVREFPRLKGHKRGIQALVFSRDGKKLASVGKDDAIYTWNITGGDPVGSILGSGANFYGADFTPNGGLITGTLKEGVRVYSSSLKLVRTMTVPGGQGANDVSMNRTGTTVATADRGGSVTLWSLASGSRLGALTGHSDWVIYTIMSPNGLIAASSSTDRTVRFWNVKSMKPVAKLDEMSVIGSPMAFSGNGRFFAAADSSDSLVIYSIAPAVGAGK